MSAEDRLTIDGAPQPVSPVLPVVPSPQPSPNPVPPAPPAPVTVVHGSVPTWLAALAALVIGAGGMFVWHHAVIPTPAPRPPSPAPAPAPKPPVPGPADLNLPAVRAAAESYTRGFLQAHRDAKVGVETGAITSNNQLIAAIAGARAPLTTALAGAVDAAVRARCNSQGEIADKTAVSAVLDAVIQGTLAGAK